MTPGYEAAHSAFWFDFPSVRIPLRSGAALLAGFPSGNLVATF
jgi:hypothetical protein